MVHIPLPSVKYMDFKEGAGFTLKQKFHASIIYTLDKYKELVKYTS
jgi:hypothetical protein